MPSNACFILCVIEYVRSVLENIGGEFRNFIREQLKSEMILVNDIDFLNWV